VTPRRGFGAPGKRDPHPVMKTKEPLIVARLRKLCLSLPEASETLSWGHPNFRAGKAAFVTFEWVRGNPSIAFRLPGAVVSHLLLRPGFFPTPYGRGRWVSLELKSRINWSTVKALVLDSYRTVALKRMIHALEFDAS
jgi:predicted DNA-binding protein (MmcQ/YjbR family)